MTYTKATVIVSSSRGIPGPGTPDQAPATPPGIGDRLCLSSHSSRRRTQATRHRLRGTSLRGRHRAQESRAIAPGVSTAAHTPQWTQTCIRPLLPRDSCRVPRCRGRCTARSLSLRWPPEDHIAHSRRRSTTWGTCHILVRRQRCSRRRCGHCRQSPGLGTRLLRRGWQGRPFAFPHGIHARGTAQQRRCRLA